MRSEHTVEVCLLCPSTTLDSLLGSLTRSFIVLREGCCREVFSTCHGLAFTACRRCGHRLQIDYIIHIVRVQSPWFQV